MKTTGIVLLSIAVFLFVCEVFIDSGSLYFFVPALFFAILGGVLYYIEKGKENEKNEKNRQQIIRSRNSYDSDYQ